MFGCNLPPALLVEGREPFMCHCSNTVVERTPNKSQHTKLTLEKKILLPLLPGFAPFRSRDRRSNQQAIPTASFEDCVACIQDNVKVMTRQTLRLTADTVSPSLSRSSCVSATKWIGGFARSSTRQPIPPINKSRKFIQKSQKCTSVQNDAL